MATSPGRSRPVLGFFFLFAVSTFACVTGGASSRRDGLSAEDQAALPSELRANYELFAARCSRCHTLARPLSANITEPEHWRAYVERMRKQSGSGISRSDGEQILRFLEHYAAQQGRADEGEGESQ